MQIPLRLHPPSFSYILSLFHLTDSCRFTCEEGQDFPTIKIPSSFFFGHIAQHVGSSLPNQGLNLCLLQWKWGALTPGPLGKSQGPFLILLHTQSGFFHQVTPKQDSSWASDSHCYSGYCNLASIFALSFSAPANANSDLLTGSWLPPWMESSVLI